jgi:hypothetical protein
LAFDKDIKDKVNLSEMTLKSMATAITDIVSHKREIDREPPRDNIEAKSTIIVKDADDRDNTDNKGEEINFKTAHEAINWDDDEHRYVDFEESLKVMNATWVDPTQTELNGVVMKMMRIEDSDVLMADTGANTSVIRDASLMNHNTYEGTASHSVEVKGINKGNLDVQGVANFVDD